MVEVDPVILALGASTIAGLITIILCLNAKKSTENKKTKEKKAPVKAAEKPQVESTNELKKQPLPKKDEDKVAPKSANSTNANQPEKKEKEKPLPAVVTQTITPKADDPSNIKEGGKKSKETSEQREARIARQKARKGTETDSSKVTAEVPLNTIIDGPKASASVAEEWEIVEDKRKEKKAKKQATMSAAAVVKTKAEEKSDEPAVPLDNNISAQLLVESRKIPAIMGLKGATLKALQDATSCQIIVPKNEKASKSVTLLISGKANDVAIASEAIQELANKGYCNILEGDGFQEHNVSIYKQLLPEIIGKGYCNINAIKEACEVKVSIPETNNNDKSDKVKIKVAGKREAIQKAKDIMNEIIEFHHSSVTHPGFVHVSLDISKHLYSTIIGPKGSEIRHIENNFKVDVHIPSDNSVHKNVLVVGPPAGVEAAHRYILKIVGAAADQQASNLEGWNNESDDADNNDEEWAAQYMYNRTGKKAGTISDSSAFKTLDAQKAAWNTASSSGW